MVANVNLFLATLLVVSLVSISESYRPCFEFQPIDVNEEWWNKNVRAGFNIWEHSDCLNCEKSDSEWTWIKGKTTPKKACYDFTVAINGTAMTLKWKCEFSILSKQTCTLDTKVGSVKGVLLVAYQNQNVVAGSFCTLGKEQNWWIGGPGQVDAAELQKGRDALKKLGFDTNNIATSSSAFVFKHLLESACD